MHSAAKKRAIQNETNSSVLNQKVHFKCSALIGILDAKLELLSKALEDANTKNAATWTKVDEELSSLNEYLTLSTPGPLAAKKVIQLSDAGIKIAMASLVDRRKILGRAVSIQKANPTIRRLSEDRLLDSRKLGHSSSREEHAEANDRDPGQQFLLTHRRPPEFQRQQCSGGDKPHVDGAPKLATLIAGDSDVHTSTKERRLQPNKPHTIRQIRKLLAGFKVQSSAKTSLMGAPPKELLLGAVTQRLGPHRDTFKSKPRQSAQETKQRQDCPLNNSKSACPKGGIERATSSSGGNVRPREKKLRPPKVKGLRKLGSHEAKKICE
ncbi:hypothetical protein CLF_102968 [Clonorchis sinensis]|uniref:Uncharacterized protein n=1 Tax=Clonorchis sinensis TaxID=79923 RepID=G7YN94_CLOSI|nr:hypothetical protein CLF_102968 [Clonorchis sinensis]